jgi:hypothetical protein
MWRQLWLIEYQRFSGALRLHLPNGSRRLVSGFEKKKKYIGNRQPLTILLTKSSTR